MHRDDTIAMQTTQSHQLQGFLEQSPRNGVTSHTMVSRLPVPLQIDISNKRAPAGNSGAGMAMAATAVVGSSGAFTTRNQGRHTSTVFSSN